MAKTEFTTYTYEVSTETGGKWVLDTIFSVKWRAIEHAEGLVNQNKFSAVRVTSESNDPSARTNVIFNQKCGVQAKKDITISRVDEAPPCSKLTDYYEFPARKTIGRLLRQFLNNRGITAIELLFDYGNLLSIERHDTLLLRAVQRITTLQTQNTNLSDVDVSNTHYNMFDEVKRRANILDMDRRRYGILKNEGVPALLDDLKKAEGKDDPVIGLYHTLAVHLNEYADLDKKLMCLLDLLEQSPNEKFSTVIDETIAELMDNTEVVAAILKEKPEVGIICKFFIDLSMGEIEITKHTHPCVNLLKQAMIDEKLPVTKELLIGKVRSQMKSISPLIKSSNQENRECFVNIVRSLKERTGFVGGVEMSAAITLRAKITLKTGPDDLTVTESIESILGLVPDPAIRLGYLLDLSQSELKTKYLKNIIGILENIEKKLHSISSLIPDLTKPRDSFCVLSGILLRLNEGEYPKELKERLEEKVISYLKLLEESIEMGTPIIDENQISDSEAEIEEKISAPTNEKVKPSKTNIVKAGTYIFSEGDEADCAYIIKKGAVEIFRIQEGEKVTLITLGPNQIFGELALLEDKPRSAHAKTISDTVLTKVTKKALHTQIDGLNGFMRYWLLHLSDRVLDLTDRIEK